MTADEKIELIRDRVIDAERLIREALTTILYIRHPAEWYSLEKSANVLRDLSPLMIPRTVDQVWQSASLSAHRA